MLPIFNEVLGLWISYGLTNFLPLRFLESSMSCHKLKKLVVSNGLLEGFEEKEVVNLSVLSEAKVLIIESTIDMIARLLPVGRGLSCDSKDSPSASVMLASLYICYVFFVSTD